MSAIDHVGLACRDLQTSTAFYQAALAPLGIALLVELTAEQTGGRAHAGFGSERPFFYGWVPARRRQALPMWR